MSKRKEAPDGDILGFFTRKTPRTSNATVTISDSPTSSTSEAPKKLIRRTLKRSDDGDDDDIPNLITKRTKPKPSSSPITNKQPFKPLTSTASKKREEDSENESESASDDDDNPEENKITLTENIGDMFTAPPKTLLLHACNCQGSWNAGIAQAFRLNYPDHFTKYTRHCRVNNPETIIGTCLLIPPQQRGNRHWIGCLFTSRKYGRATDSKAKILEKTESAMQDLVEQLQALDSSEAPSAAWMCKINSGLFKVPWKETKAIIENVPFEGGLHITIMDKR